MRDDPLTISVRSPRFPDAAVVWCGLLLAWKLLVLAIHGPFETGDTAGYRLYALALLGRGDPHFTWEQYGLTVNVFEQRLPLPNAILAAAIYVFEERAAAAYCVSQIVVSCLAAYHFLSVTRHFGCGKEAAPVFVATAGLSYAAFVDYTVLADSFFSSAFLALAAAVCALVANHRTAINWPIFALSAFALLTLKSFGVLAAAALTFGACAIFLVQRRPARIAKLASIFAAVLALSGAFNARMAGSGDLFAWSAKDHAFGYANALFALQRNGAFEFTPATPGHAHAAAAIAHSESDFRRGVFLVSKLVLHEGRTIAETETALSGALKDAIVRRPGAIARFMAGQLGAGLLDSFASMNKAFMPMMTAVPGGGLGPLRLAAILYDGALAWIVAYFLIGAWFASLASDARGLRRAAGPDALCRAMVGAAIVVLWLPVALLNFEIRLIAFTIPFVAVFGARWLTTPRG